MTIKNIFTPHPIPQSGQPPLMSFRHLHHHGRSRLFGVTEPSSPYHQGILSPDLESLMIQSALDGMTEDERLQWASRNPPLEPRLIAHHRSVLAGLIAVPDLRPGVRRQLAGFIWYRTRQGQDLDPETYGAIATYFKTIGFPPSAKSYAEDVDAFNKGMRRHRLGGPR